MKITVPARREACFLLLAAGAAALCAAMAFWFTVPLRPQPQTTTQTVPLVQLARVDLNTAGLDALTLLPGIGEQRAQAILDYRRQNGAFRRVEDAAKVPGLTVEIVASWGELATVS